MMLINKNDLFLLEEIVKKNFSAKYKDSVLGILWSVLKPLMIMIIMTIVFGTIFKGIIDNYPVYILSGRCLYEFFTNGVGIAMLAIKSNKNILSKSPAPKYIFVIGSILSEFINFIITLVILVGVMIVTNSTFYFSVIPLSIIPILSLSIMITGISLMLSILCVYYSDIQHLWGVIVLLLMYSSAIFYPISIIPDSFYKILILNPLYWVIDQFRMIIMSGTMPSFLYMFNSLLISTIILVMGIIVFMKYQDRVMLKL